MKEGPDIALLGSLIGEPARANMLTALMSGKALTATELAGEAGVTAQTATAHLKRLEEGGLIRQRKQGRHRYFALSGADVGDVLEAMMGLAAGHGHLRTRTGPKDPALRKARICYNHLAGEMRVRAYESMVARSYLSERADRIELTDHGHVFVAEFGIDISAPASSRRPLCRSCLDWSSRRTHLAGRLGEAFLDRFQELSWARREPESRRIAFTRSGEAAFLERFPI
jgi:DNA-binding transcriptional ArsR family regulator